MTAKEKEEKPKSRSDYGLEETDLSFVKEEKEDYFKIDDSYAQLSASPANSIFSHFYKVFLVNEQHALELFKQWEEQIEKFNILVNENFFYEDMEIVKQMIMVLNKYKDWVISLRQSVFSAKATVEELDKVIRKEYVTKEEMKKTIEEVEQQIDDGEVFRAFVRDNRLIIDVGHSKDVHLNDYVRLKRIGSNELTDYEAVYFAKKELERRKNEK